MNMFLNKGGTKFMNCRDLFNEIYDFISLGVNPSKYTLFEKIFYLNMGFIILLIGASPFVNYPEYYLGTFN